jgi:hypothetical protein
MIDKNFEMASMPMQYKTHELKTWPEFFRATYNGLKPWDLRKNDRKFQVGDKLILREYNPAYAGCEYTGHSIDALVTYILADVPYFGLQEGFVILGVQIMKKSLSTIVQELHHRKIQEIAGELLNEMEGQMFMEGQQSDAEIREMANRQICMDILMGRR